MAGQRSNQLNYVPTCQINEMRNRQCLYGSARFTYLRRLPVTPRHVSRLVRTAHEPPGRNQGKPRSSFIVTASEKTRKTAHKIPRTTLTAACGHGLPSYKRLVIHARFAKATLTVVTILSRGS